MNSRLLADHVDPLTKGLVRALGSREEDVGGGQLSLDDRVQVLRELAQRVGIAYGDPPPTSRLPTDWFAPSEIASTRLAST